MNQRVFRLGALRWLQARHECRSAGRSEPFSTTAIDWVTALVQSRLLVVLSARYPGERARLGPTFWRAVVIVHALLIGQKVAFSGPIIFRDHRNGVLGRCVFAGEELDNCLFRGIRFSMMVAQSSKFLIAESREVRNLSSQGIRSLLSGVAYGTAVECCRTTKTRMWCATVVTFDQSPATQVLGVLSNLRSRPLALTNFALHPLSFTAANRPVYRYSSVFQFANSPIQDAQDLPTTLIFEHIPWRTPRDTSHRISTSVVILLARSTSMWRVLSLILTLYSTGALREIILRPHPRRIWPALYLAVLPKVKYQDSRRSAITGIREPNTIILTTTVGTPLVAAMASKAAVYAVAALDGPDINSAANWHAHSTTSSSAGASLAGHFFASRPSRKQLLEVVETVRVAAKYLTPSTHFCGGTVPNYLVRRVEHLAALRSGHSPAT